MAHSDNSVVSGQQAKKLKSKPKKDTTGPAQRSLARRFSHVGKPLEDSWSNLT